MTVECMHTQSAVKNGTGRLAPVNTFLASPVIPQHAMTITDEIKRAARHLIETHGAAAARIADKRVASLDGYGELAGTHVWRQIATAVRAIQTGRGLSVS
jgi:hypothetical protein